MSDFVSIFINGTPFYKIAKELYKYKIEVFNCRDVYDNSDYIQLCSKKEGLIEQIKQALPERLQANLEEIENDIDPAIENAWDEFFYQRGFFDGLLAMQILIYKLYGKSVKSEIVKLLDDYWCNELKDGGGLSSDGDELYREVIDMINEQQTLDGFGQKFLVKASRYARLQQELPVKVCS